MALPKFVRVATVNDCEKMRRIYGAYLGDSAKSFETEIPSKDEFEARFKDTIESYPWLVFTVNEEVVGFAYGSRHRSRHAYRWSADLTVYVDFKHKRKNIGRTLYLAVIDLLELQGYYNAFGGVTLPNAGSEGLHLAMGFKKIAEYEDIGFKVGKWHTVAWFQFKIRSGGEPGEIIPFSELVFE